jgi:phospholipid-binding lipoprotein MlaA
MRNTLIVFTLLFILVATPSFSEEISVPSLSPFYNVFQGSQSESESGSLLYAQQADSPDGSVEEEEEDLDYLDEEEDEISDPLEPLNRVFFAFNDQLYFLLLKPVTRGYSFILPEGVRISIRNFFDNIATPIRLVNNLLQFKFKPAGNELLRFGVNSTVGVLGLFDIAQNRMDIKAQDEDFGQTLGKWGLGPGFYINWPVLGPSSLRDSVGYAGDYFLDPVNYIDPEIDRYAIKIGDQVNRTSFVIGDYEEIKKDAIDPYAAIRDIYHQYRKSKIDR